MLIIKYKEKYAKCMFKIMLDDRRIMILVKYAIFLKLYLF